MSTPEQKKRKTKGHFINLMCDETYWSEENPQVQSFFKGGYHITIMPALPPKPKKCVKWDLPELDAVGESSATDPTSPELPDLCPLIELTPNDIAAYEMLDWEEILK